VRLKNRLSGESASPPRARGVLLLRRLVGLDLGRVDERGPAQVHEGEVIGELVVPAQVALELVVQHLGDVLARRLAILVADADPRERPLGSRAGDDEGAFHVPESVRHDEPPLRSMMRFAFS
jgi:hypothetical protein